VRSRTSRSDDAVRRHFGGRLAAVFAAALGSRSGLYSFTQPPIVGYKPPVPALAQEASSAVGIGPGPLENGASAPTTRIT
jgi:hypothetical protein